MVAACAVIQSSQRASELIRSHLAATRSHSARLRTAGTVRIIWVLSSAISPNCWSGRVVRLLSRVRKGFFLCRYSALDLLKTPILAQVMLLSLMRNNAEGSVRQSAAAACCRTARNSKIKEKIHLLSPGLEPGTSRTRGG